MDGNALWKDDRKAMPGEQMQTAGPKVPTNRSALRSATS